MIKNTPVKDGSILLLHKGKSPESYIEYILDSGTKIIDVWRGLNYGRGRTLCKCLCYCGKEYSSTLTKVVNGKKPGCGCSIHINLSKALKGIKKTKRKTYFSDYEVAKLALSNMSQRCNNPNNKNYNRYGKRGIKVCDRWSGKNKIENFIADMGSRPSNKHSIDRINNDGDYEPSNCKWSTQKEQCYNKNNNKIKRLLNEEN